MKKLLTHEFSDVCELKAGLWHFNSNRSGGYGVIVCVCVCGGECVRIFL